MERFSSSGVGISAARVKTGYGGGALCGDMMPIDSDDPFLEDIVQHVEHALESIRLEGFDVRDSIVDGLREALESAAEMEEELGQPEVVVLEGGRSANEPVTEGEDVGPRPELRVLSNDGDDDESSDLQWAADDIQVKVFTPEMLAARSLVEPERVSGAILVDHALGGQTVYRGKTSQTYRIFGADGLLEVSADGDWVETLNPGQSIDICAQLIQVRTSEADPVVGTYIRL